MEMADDRIANKEIAMARRIWRKGWLTAPGISVALLPKLACPLCWPFYSGIVSSVGLGFLISTKYLLPLTVALLIFTLGVLAYHGKQRGRHGPFALGIVGAGAVLIGKFDLQSNWVTFTGIVCPSGGISLERMASASRGIVFLHLRIVFLQRQERQHNAKC